MDKIKGAEFIVVLFIISISASFVRLCFHRNDHFWKTVGTFVGGIVFGTLAGYIFYAQSWLKGFEKVVSAVASLSAKEVVPFLIIEIPVFLKKFSKAVLLQFAEGKNKTS